MYFVGTPVSLGTVIGKAYILAEEEVVEESVSPAKQELERWQLAVASAKQELQETVEKVSVNIGLKEAQIFQAHLLFLEDPVLVDEVEKLIIEKSLPAKEALKIVGQNLDSLFSSINDPLIRSRLSDLQDIQKRLLYKIDNLKSIHHLPYPAIVVTKELTPSEVVSLDREKILGIVTEKGGVTSHAAILARAMGIPAVLGIDGFNKYVKNQDTVIIDGEEGKVWVRPDSDTISLYQSKERAQYKLAPLPDYISVMANINYSEEAHQALALGAQGVGLFRTEYLFFNRGAPPSEEEQICCYKEVLEIMKPYWVIFRTLDIGGDKGLPYLKLPFETNPFLGIRGIRFSLKEKALFRTQIRAILRANSYGNAKIMVPMITQLDEVMQVKEIIDEVAKEIKCQTIPFGIMVEVPSVAIACELYAPYVDFFSIGTNDLVAYTLAVDRNNERVSYLFHPFDPSVLRLIKKVIQTGKEFKIDVELCGEMASDPEAIPILLEMGLDKFSVGAGLIPQVREIISQNIIKQ